MLFARSILLVLTVVGLAYGHVTVQPRQSTVDKVETYTLRVPTEKPIPTVRVEVEFPPTLKVVSFDPKAGWKIDETRNTSGDIVAVVLTGSIPPMQSAQFVFSARNPAVEGRVSLKAVQIYEDGSRAEWVGPEGSRSPAPAVEIRKERSTQTIELRVIPYP